ncbi:sigma factor-like helix-turn-helix DNA-binding protein [Pedobacter sp. MR2016-24]|uniref:sigma factor-like helix-turn-helix DNA-binding protein n=1 Tax=Pedobacter sp. MR2016-24 TaxID=2994466 RepID=UPI003A4D5CC8
MASLSTIIEQGNFTADKKIREKELQPALDKAIARLPKKMKRIFELSKLENLSNKEIAAVMKVFDKTVRNKLSNALKIIKLKITTH